MIDFLTLVTKTTFFLASSPQRVNPKIKKEKKLRKNSLENDEIRQKRHKNSALAVGLRKKKVLAFHESPAAAGC